MEEKFNIESGVKEVTIIHKQALAEKEPRKVNISGNINAVSEWLLKRYHLAHPEPSDLLEKASKSTVVFRDSHVIIDRDKMEISLNTRESDPLNFANIKGSMTVHPDFKKWRINEGAEWDHKQLSDFIKMNRSCFSDKSAAMSLSAELASIRVKTDKEMEKSDNNRGAIKSVIVQNVIDTNIPKSFLLNVPVFKGTVAASFEVEVYINANTFNVSLVSPDANDLISDLKDYMIDQEVKKIEEITNKELPIVEV